MKYFATILLLLNCNYIYSQVCIKIGSSKSYVRAVQGTPTSINKYASLGQEVWSYDYSTVTFQNDVVLEYSNNANNLKICNEYPTEANIKCFSIGNSKNDVRAVQGTPTSINKYASLGQEVWSYDYSTVTFQNNVVYEYSNNADNLKICGGQNTNNQEYQNNEVLRYRDNTIQASKPAVQHQSNTSINYAESDFDPYLGSTKSKVNLREGASVNYSIIKSLNAESQLYIFSLKTINGFYKVIDIETNNIGYVYKDFVEIIKKAEISESGAFQSTGKTTNYNSEVLIKNISRYNIKLIVNEVVFQLSPKTERNVEIIPGNHYYIASAPGVIPASGNQLFSSNGAYEWTFYVVTR
jgi:hypothetical protein